MAKKALDITGQRLGKLVALNRSTTDKTKWLFQCDCGTKKEIAKAVSLEEEHQVVDACLKRTANTMRRI